VTRALRLLQKAGVPFERWTEKLHDSYSITKERYAAIGYQGRGAARAKTTSSGLVNRMPYWFSVLECVLGLHDHAAGEHPLPFTAKEFAQQNKGGRGVRSTTTPSEPQKSLQGAWAEGGPPREKGSLAGRYKDLVQR